MAIWFRGIYPLKTAHQTIYLSFPRGSILFCYNSLLQLKVNNNKKRNITWVISNADVTQMDAKEDVSIHHLGHVARIPTYVDL